MKGGGRLADWPVHQFCQVLRRLCGHSSFEQICSIKIRPKIGRGKPGNNGLCSHHTEASMHPGSPALHPLLCGGSTTTTTTSEQPAAVFSSAAPLLFLSRVAMFGQQQQTRCPARWVRLLRRPQQAEKQAAGLTNRRRTLPCSRPIRAQVRSRGTGAPHLVAAKGTLRAISGPHFEALPLIFVKNLSMFENQTRVNSEENI